MNSIEEIPEDYMITKRNLNPLARLKKYSFLTTLSLELMRRLKPLKSARLLQKFAFEN